MNHWQKSLDRFDGFVKPKINKSKAPEKDENNDELQREGSWLSVGSAASESRVLK